VSALLHSATRLCDRTLDRIGPGPTRDGVERVRRRLGEPVRIAVVGRVSSGKSTLVNALLGMRVAPTAAGECTRVVTWFSYGEVDSAELRLRDGSTMQVRLGEDRSLPERFGVAIDSVESIRVRLYTDKLERVTLLDTPGLESLRPGASDRTQQLMFGDSQRAVSEADAIVHVMASDVRSDDLGVVERFRAGTGDLEASAVNSVAVLTKIDKLGETREEIAAAAARTVRRCAAELGPSVASVVPVVGLLAEAAHAGRLGEERAARLRWLAGLDDAERRRALHAARRRLAEAQLAPAEDPDGVVDLLEVLDRFGVRSCVEAVQAGRTGASALTDHLRGVSDFAPLQTLLDDAFAARGDTLKASAGLAALHRLRDPCDRANVEVLAAELRAEADEIAMFPEARWMRTMEVFRQLTGGAIVLPGALGEDVRNVALGATTWQRLGLSAATSTSVQHDAAIQGVVRWRSFRHDGRRTPDEERAAHVMTMAYSTLARDATPQPR
jgi:GTPase SAR1 family protein